MGAPSTLGVQSAGKDAAKTVGCVTGLGLRGDDVTLAALRAVAIGLLQFAELELMHNSLVVVDFHSSHLA